MKKTLILIFTLMSVFVLVSCGGPKLNLYLPNEYIDEELLKAFKKETGIRVSAANFDHNEQALSSLQRVSYDLVIPSDYAIEELSSKGLLLELDWTKINEFNKETDFNENLNVLLKDLDTGGFNMLKYSAPYFWGNLGIVYDTRNQGLQGLIEEQGWNVLVNNNNDELVRVIYDSSRDGVFVALKAQNISLLTATISNITSEAARFLESTNHKNTLVLSDQILYNMIDSNKTKYDLSVAYSGDAVYLMNENKYLDFIVPHQGTNVFVDGFVIPKNSKNVEAAYKFINFMYKYENAYKNTVEVGYSSPIKTVYDAVSNDENVYKNNTAYHVSYNPLIDEFFRYDDTKKNSINDVWNKFVAGRG